jgi:2-desacetyl-2-hydroxyethyl bacteriochlorophyllide A dehydrogenase
MIRRVVFTKSQDIELQEMQSSNDPGPDQIEVMTEFSVVSAGTELSILRGVEGWAPLPATPGYGAIGIISRIGSNVKKFSAGERVFCYGPHQSRTLVDASGFVVRVPDGVEPRFAVMARMGQVAFTSVRVIRPELGDVVAVTGLGLVGNLAAQLMQLSGCTVIGLDVSPRRLAIAKSCGIDHVVNSRETDPVAAVKSLTQGAMCQAVVEATGVPDMAATAVKLAATHGDLVLLGTPRGPFGADATELLRAVHLASSHVTLKGGHEWIVPPHPIPFVKHSLERNVLQLFALMKNGKLRVPELVSHCVPPTQCRDVYTQLRERSENYFGVIFDWKAIA